MGASGFFPTARQRGAPGAHAGCLGRLAGNWARRQPLVCRCGAPLAGWAFLWAGAAPFWGLPAAP